MGERRTGVDMDPRVKPEGDSWGYVRLVIVKRDWSYNGSGRR